MSDFSLESVYGASDSKGIAYRAEEGEMFVAMNRIVKKIKIRSSTTSVLSFRAEEEIASLSVDGDLLLVLDRAGRVYLYSLSYNVEIGRMVVRECAAAVVKNKKIYTGHGGYLQEWVADSSGFFTFRKTKHITGHKDTIKMMVSTESGVLTSGADNTVQFYSGAGDKMEYIRGSRSMAVCARRVGEEVVAVLENGEIYRARKEDGEWVVVKRKFTMVNILSADISAQGDMAVCIDTGHNVLLYSVGAEGEEPIHRTRLSENTEGAKFVEDDEWVLLTGKGSVIWEWRSNTLIFDEQGAVGQTAAAEVEKSVVTGTENGDVFVWDRGLTICTKRATPHASGVVEIIGTARGFVSVSAGGMCKVHRATGEVTKEIETEMVITAADADEEVLVVCGPGRAEVYDVKRSRKVSETEIGIPLRAKIVGTSIVIAEMKKMRVVSPDSVLTKDTPEDILVAWICGEKGEIVSLGESGMVYVYNEGLEEVEEFRALPKYTNGLGRSKGIGIMKVGEEIVITYEVARPDRKEGERKTLYGSVFRGGQETERWVVLERSDGKSGRLFPLTTASGTCVGACTHSEGVQVYSDRSSGVTPVEMWSKETPEEVEEEIARGRVLEGAVGAVRLKNARLLKKALDLGDAVLIGKYFPKEKVEDLIKMAVVVLSEGMVEKPLVLLKELLKREKAPEILKKQLSLALRPTFDIATATTGYADALLAYPHLLREGSAGSKDEKRAL